MTSPYGSRISIDVHRLFHTPRSCDLLSVLLLDSNTAEPRTDDPHAPYLVWIIDDSGIPIVRAATDLPGVLDVARAYCDAWGGRVRYVETVAGELLGRSEWEPLLSATDRRPLPYVFTVELRTPRSADLGEMVSALWTTTDLDEAVRWRASLPDGVRSRTLIVSNAPDGHYPPMT